MQRHRQQARAIRGRGADALPSPGVQGQPVRIGPRYDWDGMYVAMLKRVNDQGLPETQAEWVGEVQEWFIANSEAGDAPDERTIRRRITPVWKALRGS